MLILNYKMQSIKRKWIRNITSANISKNPWSHSEVHTEKKKWKHLRKELN